MSTFKIQRAWLAVAGIGAAVAGFPASAFDAVQEARVVAADPGAIDMFGRVVALDGDTAIIAAPLDDTGAADSGSVYVFSRGSSGWVQEAKLLPPVALTNGYFGSAVAVDGDTLMIGSGNGRVVYVYGRDLAGWSLRQTLSPAESPFQFGASIALQGDAAVIGAYFAVNGTGAYAGAAYVYARNSTGAWVQQQKLTASDGANNDYFGYSVALDGDTAVIAAVRDDTTAADTGSVYVFARSSGVWSQQAKLLASDGLTGDDFGISVDVEGDTAVVASFRAPASVYVFTRSGTAWAQGAKLTAGDSGIAGTYDVDLQGSILLMGAANDSRAFVFGISGGSWTQLARLTPSPFGLFFGYSLALDGERALIGAYGDGHAGTFSGSAYFYTLDIVQTPAEQIADLQAVVASLALDSGVDIALLAKLSNAQAALARGDPGSVKAAVGMLNAFIQSTLAQRGKALSEPQADELVADAMAVIESLSAN